VAIVPGGVLNCKKNYAGMKNIVILPFRQPNAASKFGDLIARKGHKYDRSDSCGQGP